MVERIPSKIPSYILVSTSVLQRLMASSKHLPSSNSVRGSWSLWGSEETLEAIKPFPRPTNITGIRSFFGLVEQVAWAFSKTTVMLPFKPLLSKSASFAWSAELQHAFESAREATVQAVKDGVKTFSPNAVTCLSTDWSNIGLGAVLWQKHCSCAGVSLMCCNGGWLFWGVRSRYCNPAESNYAPIEGEALGVYWGLDKFKHYTLGLSLIHI